MNEIVPFLFAALTFVVTFTGARMLAKWWHKRNAEKRAIEVAKGQSRQVRRARERRADR